MAKKKQNQPKGDASSGKLTGKFPLGRVQTVDDCLDLIEDLLRKDEAEEAQQPPQKKPRWIY